MPPNPANPANPPTPPGMPTEDPLPLVLLVVAILIAAWVMGSEWRRSRQRRRTRARYQELAHSRPQHLQTRPGPLAGMDPDRAELVRIDAANAARIALVFPEANSAPPHPKGSPEYVMWLATFHITQAELLEGLAPADTGATGEPSAGAVPKVHLPRLNPLDSEPHPTQP
jgi:hypothetical protein